MKMSLCMFFLLSFYIALVFGSENQVTNSDSVISLLREELKAQQIKFGELEKSHEHLSEKLEFLTNNLDKLRSEISEDHGVWLLTPPLRGPPGPQGAKARLELDFPSFCTTAQLRFRASSTTNNITYPQTGEYGNYLDLCYIISSPADEKVSLKVTRVITEGTLDYLEIYKSEDGVLLNFKNGSLSGELGSSLEEQFTSNVGEPLLIHFHTDGSVTKEGFSFSFNTGDLAVEAENLNGTSFGNYWAEETELSPTPDFTDGQLDFSPLGNCTTEVRLRASDETQHIKYPASGQYENNLDLCYIILAPSDERIFLNVTKIKTEAGYDYLNVYKSADGEFAKLRKYTGNLGGSVEEGFTSNLGEPLVLYFHSDSSVTDEGFSFSFSTVDLAKNPQEFPVYYDTNN